MDQPAGTHLRRALEWLVQERSSRPEVSLVKLVDEAALRFDLSAAQSEWLLRNAMETGLRGRREG